MISTPVSSNCRRAPLKGSIPSSCQVSSNVPPRNRIHSLALTLAISLLCIAAGDAFAIPEDAEQPIHIHSDSAELDQNKSIAIYHGSVRMEQGTMTVTGDKMTVELKDQLVVRITAEGDRAHYQQQVKADESIVFADAKTDRLLHAGRTRRTHRQRVSDAGQERIHRRADQVQRARRQGGRASKRAR